MSTPPSKADHSFLDSQPVVPKKDPSKEDGIVCVSLESELKNAYLDYAMSVIISRALPDVRDGLKPVQRRILFAMIEDGFDAHKPHKKSARVVGQVISKYHPHGTDPIYGALVRMAQNFAMREPLIDGYGNFGSMDGDKAAAMRYTEARLSPLAHALLEDYEKDTVDFQSNYDETLRMPTVLPSRFPNLLINGANGIAVGMATNIPPHNLSEVMDACCALLEDDNANLEAFIKGPDFPTGGIILGQKGIQEAYLTGRGTFILTGKTHFEEVRKDRMAIIISQMPYQVNKAALLERIAQLIHQKDLEGISDLRDETDRHGVRVVIELKRDAIPDVVLNRLYSMTPLRSSFSMNMLALHKGRPLQMTLVEILKAFLAFRRQVVVRRTQHFLKKTQERAHVVFGLMTALHHMDSIMGMVRGAKDPQVALKSLMGQSWAMNASLVQYRTILEGEKETQGYSLSSEQAKAILSLRLQRLTGLERDKLEEEMKECCDKTAHYLHLLRSPDALTALMKEEFLRIKETFGSPRLTLIAPERADLDDEDLIQKEDMVVTVSLKGYIKRVPLAVYRSQKRGGRGRNAMDTRAEDAVAQVFVADTHTMLLFFTSKGHAYQLKVHQLPLASTHGLGKPLVNLFPIEQGETLATLLPVPTKGATDYILFATSLGQVRKNPLSDFESIRANGKMAMRLDETERLVSVQLANDNQDIVLASRMGKSLRFSVGDLRVFSSRQSTGVRGIMLKKGDALISMTLLNSSPYALETAESYRHGTLEDEVLKETMASHEEFLLSISERGFGKRTSSYAYRQANRAGQGIATMDVTEKTGPIVISTPVTDSDDILLLTDQGQLLRCPVKDIRISGRKTQGVKIFRLAKDEKIVSVAVLPKDDDEESGEQDSLEAADKIHIHQNEGYDASTDPLAENMEIDAQEENASEVQTDF